jgi:Flp pilus assembly protein TadD
MGKPSPSVKEIFDQALEIRSAPEREAFLATACADSPSLRRKVDDLLRAYEHAGSFLEHPTDDLIGSTVVLRREGAGTVIGSYCLREPIGEGGMGTVYLAEQTQPVQRMVALKVIKPGMDSRQVLGRFEAERQTLALMDHPNIAKVLDAGAIDSDRPYFIMELVKGVPLTCFCDAGRLTPRQRLELFIPVCRAVQHAHQKGVIHRDLKPSNVLVALYDGRPIPKIIDFGVAKATAPTRAGEVPFTELGMVVGTLEYMSPEQAGLNPLDIDTRSDIYALGVLLYELLTGTTPLEPRRLKATPLLESLRIIREVDPPMPSLRLSNTERLPSIAACRGLEPRKLRGLVRGELDWIVMKALEKDRNRRYETANGLAMDLRRYLNDEPVLACPPSAWYRGRKFVRRNVQALTMTAVLAVMLLLAVGTVAGSLGWVARDQASRQASLEREIVRGLDETESSYRRGELTEARAALRRAEGLLGTGRRSEPLGRRVEQWRTDLALVARLEEIRLEAAAVKQGHFDRAGADPAYRAEFRRYGLDVETLDPVEAARRIRSATIKDRLVSALDDWMLSKQLSGLAGRGRLLAVARAADPDRWRDRFRDAYGRSDNAALVGLAREEGLQSQPPATALLLSSVLGQIHEHALAIAVLRRAQQRYPADFWLNHNLAYLLMNAAPPQSEEAIGFYRAAVALRPESPGVRVNLGVALVQCGRMAEAEAEFRLAARLKPDYATAHYDLGNTLRGQGRMAEAEAEFRAALRLEPTYAEPRANLGRILLDDGRLVEAVAQLREAVRVKPTLAPAHRSLGNALQKQGRTAEAEAEFRAAARFEPAAAKAHAEPPSALAPGGVADGNGNGNPLRTSSPLAQAEARVREAVRLHPEDAGPHTMLGNVLRQQGRTAEAEAELRAAVRLDPKSAPARLGLGGLLSQKGRLAEAEAEYREVIRFQANGAAGRIALGGVLRQQGRLAEAEAEYRRAIQLEPGAADYRFTLGIILLETSRLAEAETEYREGLRLKPDHGGAYLGLGEILARSGRWGETAAALEQALELSAGNHFVWYRAAVLRLHLGDVEGYRKAARELRDRFRVDPTPEVAERIALTLLLKPEPAGDIESAGEFAARAMSGTEHHPFRWYFVQAEALAAVRAGRSSDAIALLEALHPKAGRSCNDARVFATLALAQHRLGDSERARAALVSAQATVAQLIPVPAQGRPFEGSWHDWLICQLLCHEAEGLLGRGSQTADRESSTAAPSLALPR